MKTFAAAFAALLQLLAVLTALMLAIVIALICLEVAARNIFLLSIQGAVDLSEYALYLMTMFMAPYLLHRGQHIRIDVVLAGVSRRTAFALELAVDAVGAVSTAILV